MANRGSVTNTIKAKSLELLGYEITQAELRLMPYVQYCTVNGENLDPKRISPHERPILSSWREKGFIEGGASSLAITKQFWDAINEILWLGYVYIGHEEDAAEQAC